MKRNTILFITFLIQIIGCSEKSNKSEEIKAFKDFLPVLLDSLHLDIYQELDDPIYNKRLKDSVLNLTKTTLIFDTIMPISKNSYISIVKENGYKTKWERQDSSIAVFPKEFENFDKKNKIYFTSNHKSLLKELLTYDEEKEFIPKDIYFVVEFKRIVFNENLDKGFLRVGALCGKLCGQGYDVWLKKVNNKWVVYKIKRTWIA